MVYKNERVYIAVPQLTIAGKGGWKSGEPGCLVLCKDPWQFPAVDASAKGNVHAAAMCFTTTTANTTRDTHQGQEALINEKLIIGAVLFVWVRPQQHGGAVLPEGSLSRVLEPGIRTEHCCDCPHGRERDRGYATYCIHETSEQFGAGQGIIHENP